MRSALIISRPIRPCAGAAAILIAAAASAAGPSYDSMRAAAVARCEAIDPSAYQSGLLMNPDGYRSFYVQSACFQDTAVQFRDEALCTKVRQRRSLFSSSWGYSRNRCAQLVREGVNADRVALEEIKRQYAAGGMTWVDFRVERNGNGRDFDIVPAFRGEYAHGYRLTFEIVPTDPGHAPALVHDDGYYVDRASNLRIYVRQVDIRQRLPEFALGRPYMVRATITLDVGFGGQAGYWSDAFIERIFAISERTRTMAKQVVF